MGAPVRAKELRTRTGANPKAAKFTTEAMTNIVVPIQNNLLCFSSPCFCCCESPNACRLFPMLIPSDAEMPSMIPSTYVHTSGSLFSPAPQEVELKYGADGGAALVPNVAAAI